MRRKQSKGEKKSFSRTASKTHKKNDSQATRRGGIRL